MTTVLRQFTCDNGHDWFIPATAAKSKPQLICPFCHAAGRKIAGKVARVDPVEATTGLFPGFEIIRELGRGGMGVVYLAYHQKFRQHVALKVLPKTLADAALPNALARFQNEFRVVRKVVHPNLVSLYEFVSDGERWFFTMEYVPGENLRDHWDRWNPKLAGKLDEAPTTPLIPTTALSDEQARHVREVFDQLASGIDALHAAGVVHRDIKPTNVMITSQGRVVLLDFGLITGWGARASRHSTEFHFLGTPKYMPPDQAAGRATPACDWYAFGTMLYEALAGRLPYKGNRLTILQKKARRDPPRLHDLRVGIPEDLCELCSDLLARDPSKRPAAAEIRRRLNATARSDSAAVFLAPPSARKLAEPALLGRETELAALNEALTTVRQGTPLSVFVVGSSGAGKSALVSAFLDAAERDNRTAVLRGRCYERESVPFKALDGLMDGLQRHLRALPPATATAVSPRDAEALLQVFPVLGRVAALAAMPPIQGLGVGQAAVRQRAIQALRELLIRLADQRPLVVCIDDLQWGDKDSAELLSQLLRPPDPPRMLFLGVYRREDAAASDFLKTLEEQRARGEQHFQRRDLDIRPLERDEACRLAAGWLGQDTAVGDPWCERIATESGGMPFFIRELANYYLETAADDETEESPNPFSPDKLNQLSLDNMIWARVAGLPPGCREVLETVAVAGRPISLEIVGECLADFGDAVFGPPLTTLSQQQLVRVVGVAKTETYHDRIRESVLAHLETSRRKEIHRRLATALEAAGDAKLVGLAANFKAGNSLAVEELSGQAGVDWPWVCDLAWHFAEAEAFARALPYALWAATRAHSQHSLEIAEQHFQIAERAAESVNSVDAAAAVDAADRGRIAEWLGDVLMLRAKYPAAAERLATAKRLAATTNDLARIEGKIGELAFKRGDVRDGWLALQEALRLLGCTVPRNDFNLVLQTVWELGVQVIHTHWPGIKRHRGKSPPTEIERLRFRLYHRLGYAYWFARGRVWTLWSHLSAMNVAERMNSAAELADAYAGHGPGMSLIGWFHRGLRYARRSYQLRKSLGDTWGQAQSLHFMAITLYAASKFRSTVRKCRRAIATLERLGDFWEQNMARYHLAVGLYRLGELAEAAAEASRMHRLGCEIGDVQSSGIALEVLSKATLGNVAAATIHWEIERKNPFDTVAYSQILQAEAIRLLADGEFHAAVETLTTARDVARRAGISNTNVIPVLPWLATSLRLLAGQPAEAGASRAETLGQALAAAKTGCRLARRFQNDLPHALREQAMILALQGRRSKSRRLFQQSLHAAERLKMRYEHAQTLFAFSHAGLRFGWPNAARQLTEATALLNAFDVAIESNGRTTAAVFGLDFL